MVSFWGRVIVGDQKQLCLKNVKIYGCKPIVPVVPGPIAIKAK